MLVGRILPHFSNNPGSGRSTQPIGQILRWGVAEVELRNLKPPRWLGAVTKGVSVFVSLWRVCTNALQSVFYSFSSDFLDGFNY